MGGRETAAEIDSAAFGWVARLDRGAPDAEQSAELEAWLAGDPRRRGALLRAEALWSTLDVAAQTGHRASAGPPPRPQGVLARVLTRRVAFAGGGAALAAGAAALLLRDVGQTLDTSIGEVRRLPLADGSTVDLNTQSQVQVAMRPRLRRIRLRRGEAWFQVAKNPARPFVVEANNVRVRAVGTAFSVCLRDGGAEITVSEGVVEAWLVGEEKKAVRISVNQSALISDRATTVHRAAAPVAVERRLAWREGRIDLDGETVAEAVAQFNRYSARKIRIANAKLAQERIYGIFEINNQSDFVASIQAAFNARTRSDNDAITLY